MISPFHYSLKILITIFKDDTLFMLFSCIRSNYLLKHHNASYSTHFFRAIKFRNNRTLVRRYGQKINWIKLVKMFPPFYNGTVPVNTLSSIWQHYWWLSVGDVTWRMNGELKWSCLLTCRNRRQSSVLSTSYDWQYIWYLYEII